jgi:hypothetical protein
VLCTKCSSGISPVVAVDLDGTLGNYHEHFRWFASEYLDRYGPQEAYDGSLPYREWFCQGWAVDETTFREIKLAYRQGAQKRTMPLLPGAKRFMRWLTGNAEVWITTTRPYLKLDGVDRDTRNWLSRNGIVYDHMIYDEDKYGILASQVDAERVCGVLDDEKDQVLRADEVFVQGTGILMKNNWNMRVSDRIPGVCLSMPDFNEARRLLGTRLQEWKRIHR